MKPYKPAKNQKQQKKLHIKLVNWISEPSTVFFV